MIVKLDSTELNCQSVIKAYDMQNERFNVVITINEQNPDDDKYLALLKSSHVLTLVTNNSTKEYSIINRDIMYNVRYDDEINTQVTISIPVKTK